MLWWRLEELWTWLTVWRLRGTKCAMQFSDQLFSLSPKCQWSLAPWLLYLLSLFLDDSFINLEPGRSVIFLTVPQGSVWRGADACSIIRRVYMRRQSKLMCPGFLPGEIISRWVNKRKAWMQGEFLISSEHTHMCTHPYSLSWAWITVSTFQVGRLLTKMGAQRPVSESKGWKDSTVFYIHTVVTVSTFKTQLQYI